MQENTTNEFENQVLQQASRLPYPPTPDLAAAFARPGAPLRPASPRRPRLAWAAVILIAALTVLLSAAPVRAAILEFIQVGAIRINLFPPREGEPEPGATRAATAPTAAPASPWLGDLEGETTLEEARALVRFSILLPAYPPDLGLPDRVFVQDFGSQAVVLLWMEPGQPEVIRLALVEIAPGSWIHKFDPPVVEQAVVGESPAVWLEGSHPLILKNGGYQELELVVDRNVLVWEKGGITYRLEADLSKDEAVRAAESLR